MYDSATATTLALLTIAQEMQQGEHYNDREAALYHVLERAQVVQHLDDQRKAELYATAIEHDGFGRFVMDVARAIDDGLKMVQA